MTRHQKLRRKLRDGYRLQSELTRSLKRGAKLQEAYYEPRVAHAFITYASSFSDLRQFDLKEGRYKCP